MATQHTSRRANHPPQSLPARTRGGGSAAALRRSSVLTTVRQRMAVTADTSPIVSLCLAAFAGAERAAINLSLTTGLSRHITLSSAMPTGGEIEFTIEHLRRQRPALVIFNGW